MNYYEMIEEAWALSESARLYVESAGHGVDNAELWSKLFSQSPMVDVEKTRQNGGPPFTKIFFKTLYGLQYRTEQNDWIPFRHGPVDFSKDPSLA